MERFEISVRQMVEFILRAGDIERTGTLFGSDRALLRAQEGTRLHQRLQKEAIAEHPDYQSEVSLSVTIEDPPVSLTVTGRADGLYTDASGISVIEEIKSTEMQPALIGEDTYPLHWAQACCYGEMLLQDQPQDTKIRICLVYIHNTSLEVKRLEHTFLREQVHAMFDRITCAWIEWLKRDIQRRETRNEQIFRTDFPYENYRKGQRGMIRSVYRQVTEGSRALYQAPTGTGKTMAVLFPAIRALRTGGTSKIFYLTARHTAGTAATSAAQMFTGPHSSLKVIRLTAKETLCPMEKVSCRTEDCAYARGHFSRVNQAVKDCLAEESLMTAEVILDWAKKREVCPFAFSLDLADWCDLIICDYNYVFDPEASLKRYFGEGKKDYTVLVDEAHNLVDRARTMYSAGLRKSDFLKLKKLLAKTEAGRAAGRVNRDFLELKKNLPEHETEVILSDLPEELIRDLNRFCESMESLFEGGKTPADDDEKQMQQVYFEARAFLRTSRQDGEDYILYAHQDSHEVSIHLFCYHPARQLEEVYQRLNSIVFFSATLMPVSYYQEFLGIMPPYPAACLDSPFDPSHRLVMVDDTIDVTYRSRQESAGAVAERIHQLVMGKLGGYLMFFPSFAYLEIISKLYLEAYPQEEVILQTQEMTQADRAEILARFQDDGKLRIVMAVMGGVFSEGVDLTGEKLIGACCVSVGLPQIGFERDQIRKRMDARGKNGFDYAYRYPGINKVLQAAGRVIRTETDRGVILLIDSRYRQEAYRNLLPADFYPLRRVDRDSISGVLSDFWHQQKE